MTYPALSWYLAQCQKNGIVRVQPGTYEVIARPSPDYKPRLTPPKGSVK